MASLKKLKELPISRGQHTKKYWFGQDLGGKVEIIRLSIKTYPRGCSVPLDWVSDRGQRGRRPSAVLVNH